MKYGFSRLTFINYQMEMFMLNLEFGLKIQFITLYDNID